MWDYLISFADGGAESASKFKVEWDDRYPEYRVRVAFNPHDFGGYYSLEINEDAYRDEEVFENGPESAACDLADEMGFDY
jgi:hypothetical protein